MRPDPILRPSSLRARVEARQLAINADTMGIPATDPVQVGPGEYAITVGGERIVVCWSTTEVV